MTDIVAQLRAHTKGTTLCPTSRNLTAAAADEITRLRADLDAAKALLRGWDALISFQYSGSQEAMSEMTKCAVKSAAFLYGSPPWPAVDAELAQARADLAAAREAMAYVRDRVKRINFLAGLDEPIREQAAMAVDAIDAALTKDEDRI